MIRSRCLCRGIVRNLALSVKGFLTGKVTYRTCRLDMDYEGIKGRISAVSESIIKDSLTPLCLGFYAELKQGVAWPPSLPPENTEGLLKKALFNRPLVTDSIIPLVVLIPYFFTVRLRPTSQMGSPGAWLTDAYTTLPSLMVDTMLVCKVSHP